MKQLLSLFLFFLPCLVLAQYPSNGNQKITLGEQTTADGLIWRGILADTGIITPSSDTSAYIILDTVNHRFYNYNRATNVWSVTTIGSISSGLTGVLPVANGGTNTTTLTANKVMVGNGTSAVLTPTNLHWDNTNTRLGIGIANPSLTLTVISSSSNDGISTYNTATDGAADIRIGNNTNNNLGFIRVGGSTYGTTANQNTLMIGTGGGFTIHIAPNSIPAISVLNEGFVGIGTTTPQSGYRLHVVDSVYVGGRVSAAGYTTRSDYNLKDEIKNINYGLNEIMQITPVSYTYKSNGEHQLGFIAQDIGVIIPESVHFDELMGVDYQSIIPILTKAIQEQQALIKALEQRIINLENK